MTPTLHFAPAPATAQIADGSFRRVASPLALRSRPTQTAVPRRGYAQRGRAQEGGRGSASASERKLRRVRTLGSSWHDQGSSVAVRPHLRGPAQQLKALNRCRIRQLVKWWLAQPPSSPSFSLHTLELSLSLVLLSLSLSLGTHPRLFVFRFCSLGTGLLALQLARKTPRETAASPFVGARPFASTSRGSSPRFASHGISLSEPPHPSKVGPQSSPSPPTDECARASPC